MTGPAEAVPRGVAWLADAQLPSGELPAWGSFLRTGEIDWAEDRLNFITALAAEALAEVEAPTAARVVDRAAAFLETQREPGALWRYWSRENERVLFTPPDADDTACCSIAVALRGEATDANLRVLRATAAEDGRFHTWLVPHGRITDLRVRWLLRDERRPDTRALRSELWSSTEADPDDVDGVVNANVCRYLGPEHAPEGAVRWVASVVAEGEDTHDKWHRRLPTMWAAVADGARRGIAPFAAVGGSVVAQIEAWADAGADRRAIDVALALLATQRFVGPAPLVSRLADELLAAQRPDGSWPREVFYFGGPSEVFGWASEALTTAYAVAALDHLAAR